VHPCSCRNPPPPHCRPAESGRSHGKATDSARSSRLLHECKKAKRSRMRIHTCRGNARRLATPDFCPRTRSALLACSSFASRSSSSPPAANSHPPRFLAAFSGVCGAVDAAARSETAAACREDGCGLRLILMDGGGWRGERTERGAGNGDGDLGRVQIKGRGLLVPACLLCLPASSDLNPHACIYLWG
jgi:hypothetical protein